jgi:hypothetical protein
MHVFRYDQTNIYHLHIFYIYNLHDKYRHIMKAHYHLYMEAINRVTTLPENRMSHGVYMVVVKTSFSANVYLQKILKYFLQIVSLFYNSNDIMVTLSSDLCFFGQTIPFIINHLFMQ